SFALAGAFGVVGLAAQIAFLPPLPPSGRIAARELIDVVRVKAARLGLLLVGLIFVGHFAGYASLTPFLHDDVALRRSEITVLLLAFGSGGVVGNFAFSGVAQRALRPGLMLAVVLLASGALATLVLRSSPVAASCAVVIWGFAFGGVPLLLQTWMFRALRHGA